MHNVDGTINQVGTIMQYCNLWTQQGEKTTKLGFFVANLGHDRIILRHPWFKAHNPTIDWTTNTLLGPKVCIKTAGYQSKSSTTIKTTDSLKYIADPSIPEYYHRHAQVFDEKASFLLRLSLARPRNPHRTTTRQRRMTSKDAHVILHVTVTGWKIR